jgi:beta-lactamase class A
LADTPQFRAARDDMQPVDAHLIPSAVTKQFVDVGSSHEPDLQLTRYDERVQFSTLLAMLALVTQSPALPARFAEIAGRCGGELGVFAQVIGTPDSAGLNETSRFPMQSVYKLPIAMAVLDQVDRKGLTLNQKISLSADDMVPRLHSPLRDRYPRGGVTLTIRDLIRAALVDSDGTASDVLLRIGGGPSRVTGYVRGLGVRDMVIATSERAMSNDATLQYRNYSTPKAAVDVLSALDGGRGLSPESRELVLQDLVNSTPGAQRIKGLLPAGTSVAHKTGTDATRNGRTAATNDIGLVTFPDGRQLAIAVFVKDSSAGLAAREEAIAQAARTAWDRWAVRQ